MSTKVIPTWGDAAWTEPGALAEHYRHVRDFTTALCAPLEIEDYVAQSMTEASPTRWHIGHTTWFFEQFVLTPFAEGYRPFHPDFAFLFNSYYNAVGDRTARPIRGLMTRPTVGEVRRYREHVDEAVAALMQSAEGASADRISSLLEIGLHHEQQHQELLLTDIKHLLSLNPLHPAYHDPEATGTHEPPRMKWIAFDEGLRWIGHEGNGFAYDNEGPRHREFVEPFEIADRLVTNREYLQFMADGGYEHPEFWLDEGWASVGAHGWRAPLYWEQRSGDWSVFTLMGPRSLPLDEPVCHVSLFEAAAFAEWAGARLPTEAEWETAVSDHAVTGNLADRRRFHPAVCCDDEPGPLRQIIGDVWEWTQSQYRPYPGYRPVAGALGEYNGKFMCNQFVLRGGSCATHSTHIRPTYRNFFHPGARWQFTGIRLARDTG
ncbi:MAG: ergothioneine biosynthesis protein EgtB [Planctomycetota bacterium]